MNALFEKISIYFSYSFVHYALITGVMIALCASLLGVTLVLKRFSFIGDGLSHSAFGALALASVLRLYSPMLFVLPVTVIIAVFIMCTKNPKIKGDASIAMISVASLAAGYLIMSIFSPAANLSGDVCSTLFGSTLILTLKKSEVILSIILSVLVIAFFIIFYNRIFAVTFDEDFAKSCGTKTRLYSVLMAVFIAIIIVLAMNLVGSLLISALIIFPAVSAMQVCKSFKKVTVFSCIFSVITSLLGIIISVLSGTPVGPTIVAIDVLGFILSLLAGKIKK